MLERCRNRGGTAPHGPLCSAASNSEPEEKSLSTRASPLVSQSSLSLHSTHTAHRASKRYVFSSLQGQDFQQGCCFLAQQPGGTTEHPAALPHLHSTYHPTNQHRGQESFSAPAMALPMGKHSSPGYHFVVLVLSTAHSLSLFAHSLPIR